MNKQQMTVSNKIKGDKAPIYLFFNKYFEVYIDTELQIKIKFFFSINSCRQLWLKNEFDFLRNETFRVEMALIFVNAIQILRIHPTRGSQKNETNRF
jgi:hypothetical protein